MERTSIGVGEFPLLLSGRFVSPSKDSIRGFHPLLLFLFPEHNQATPSTLPDYVVPGTIYPVFLATLPKLSLPYVYYVEHK